MDTTSGLHYRLFLQFVMRETIVISVMVDTIVYGVIFVLALGISISSALTNRQVEQLPNRGTQMSTNLTVLVWQRLH
jgi:hypothetical protein